MGASMTKNWTLLQPLDSFSLWDTTNTSTLRPQWAGNVLLVPFLIGIFHQDYLPRDEKNVNLRVWGLEIALVRGGGRWKVGTIREGIWSLFQLDGLQLGEYAPYFACDASLRAALTWCRIVFWIWFMNALIWYYNLDDVWRCAAPFSNAWQLWMMNCGDVQSKLLSWDMTFFVLDFCCTEIFQSPSVPILLCQDLMSRYCAWGDN